MQKIFLEKSIDLNNELTELMALSVDESINYKMENEGIRAVGSLLIKGEYKAEELMEFEESLDLDVLATFDKIIDQRDFSIKVEDFDYHVRNGNLFVKVEAGVYGVIQGEDRFIGDSEVEETTIDEIESLIRDEFQEEILMNEQDYVREEEVEQEPLFEEEEQEIQPMVEEEIIDDSLLQEVVYESKTRPMFKDYNDSVGTYYLYIAKEDDTYDSISNYYNVERAYLMEYNQNKPLHAGAVVIVPYVA